MKIERLTESDLAPLAELFRQFWGEKSSLEKMGPTFSRLTTNPAYLPFMDCSLVCVYDAFH
jgi:hypothetical protein